MVSTSFIKNDNAFLGAVGADDEKGLNEGGSHGKCRDEEPHAGRPAVIGEQTEHRRSSLGLFYFRRKRDRSFVKSGHTGIGLGVKEAIKGEAAGTREMAGWWVITEPLETPG